MTYEELVNQYINGNNDCLTIIYNKHWNLYKKVSKQYICDINEAEDLVQSVFLKLIEMPIEKRIQYFRKIDSLPAFFYKMIKNACLDFNKKRRIKFTSLVTDQYSDANEVEYKKYLDIDYKIVGLSTNETLFFEDHLENLKPRQISLKHKKSVSTIKNTLNNAKKKIIKYYMNN